MAVFEELGYACSRITPDYGEDFFVYGEDSGIIEPFKIFVQVKTSSQLARYASDWTIYEDALTVRNWVLGNEMVILVRHDLRSGKSRYCIPEDAIVYWDLTPSKKASMRCSESFDTDAAETLLWIARIRHYDRIVRLTQPNYCEKFEWRAIPQFRLFVVEFLGRLRFLDMANNCLADDIYGKQLPLTLLFAQDCKDSEDMIVLEKGRFGACCLLILTRLREVSGCDVGLLPFFLDQCACVLVELIRHRTEVELENQLPGA